VQKSFINSCLYVIKTGTLYILQNICARSSVGRAPAF
jgi:hypothetical protein